MVIHYNNPASTSKRVATLTYAATTLTNAGAGDIFKVTLTGNTILGNPTNAKNGQGIIWQITQGGAGSYTITLDTKFVIPDSATTPLAWSTAIGDMDIFAAIYDSTADKFFVVSMIPGYN